MTAGPRRASWEWMHNASWCLPLPTVIRKTIFPQDFVFTNIKFNYFDCTYLGPPNLKVLTCLPTINQLLITNNQSFLGIRLSETKDPVLNLPIWRMPNSMNVGLCLTKIQLTKFGAFFLRHTVVYTCSCSNP